MSRPGLGSRRPVATEDLSFLTNSGGGPDRSAEIEHIPLGLVDETDHLCLRQKPYPGIDGLASQIQKHGQTTPVFVRPTEEGRYELISGYRRREALASISAPTILARVYRGLTDEAAYELAVSENADRDDLTDWERALVCQRLRTQGVSSEDIARVFQWSDPRQVQNHVKVAKQAPGAVSEALQSRELKMTHALSLMRTGSAPFGPEDSHRMTRHVIDRGLSVRATQSYVDAELLRLEGKGKAGRAVAETLPVRVRELRAGGFSVSAKVTKDSSHEHLVQVEKELGRLLKRVRALQKQAEIKGPAVDPK